MIALHERGGEAVREAQATTSRRLRLAAVTTAAESFVPPLMRSFIAEHPDIELSLDVGNREYVFGRLLAHDADVAISGTPPSDERLLAKPLCDNEIACITARDDPLAAEGPVPASALAERPWLLRELGSGTRALIEQLLAMRGLAPRTLTLGSNGAIRQAAHAGLGVSLLSR